MMALNMFNTKLICAMAFLCWNTIAQATTPIAPAEAEKMSQQSTMPTSSTTSCPAILRYKFNRLQDDASQDLCQYAGKVILVVNTASFCGFTKQYEGLEALYAKYKDRGLVVLGFPSNDFGKQEPGSSKEIADFCYNTYGVKFPMFAKSSVKGDAANPLYVTLIKKTGTTPKWNFYKYLIDRKGNIVDSYTSVTTPENKGLVGAIEKALVN